MITMTLEEFKTAVRSQGKPIEKVTFQCPRCKTLQCGQDLIDASAGKTFDEIEKYLGFSCIGRFTDKKGCDWTLGGLFKLHKLEVVTPDGMHHPRFMPVKVED